MGNLSDALPNDWDPYNAADEEDDSSPIPEGWYEATILKSELKHTRAGNGQYINLGFRIDGPSHAKRWVWCNLNIINPSERAQRIGRAQFGKLCKALGRRRKPKDTEDLLENSCKIYVTQNEFNGKTQNEVKKFDALEGAAAGPPKSQPKTSKKNSPWD